MTHIEISKRRLSQYMTIKGAACELEGLECHKNAIHFYESRNNDNLKSRNRLLDTTQGEKIFL